jgi:hypothetical protein
MSVDLSFLKQNHSMGISQKSPKNGPFGQFTIFNKNKGFKDVPYGISEFLKKGTCEPVFYRELRGLTRENHINADTWAQLGTRTI